MVAEPRETPPPGGLDCLEVLEHLSDFIDDELPSPLRSRIVAHVQACPNCARFGGVYAEVIGRLRTQDPAQAVEKPFDVKALLDSIATVDEPT